MSIATYIQTKKAKKQIKKYNKKFNIAHFFIPEYYLFYKTEDDADQKALEKEMTDYYEDIKYLGLIKYDKTNKFISLLNDNTHIDFMDKESEFYLLQDNHILEFIRYFNWLLAKIHVYYKFNQISGNINTLSAIKYNLNKKAVNLNNSFYPLVINKYLGEDFKESLEQITINIGFMTELELYSKSTYLDNYIDNLYVNQENQIKQFSEDIHMNRNVADSEIPYHLNQFLNFKETTNLIDNQLTILSNKYIKNAENDTIRKLYLEEHYSLCYCHENILRIKNPSEYDTAYDTKKIVENMLQGIMSLDLILDYLIKIRIQLFKILNNIQFYKQSLIVLDKYLITFESIYLICRELSFYNFKFDLLKENFYFELFDSIKNLHTDLVKNIELDEKLIGKNIKTNDMNISSEDRLKIAKEYFQLEKNIVENK